MITMYMVEQEDHLDRAPVWCNKRRINQNCQTRLRTLNQNLLQSNRWVAKPFNQNCAYNWSSSRKAQSLWLHAAWASVMSRVAPLIALTTENSITGVIKRLSEDQNLAEDDMNGKFGRSQERPENQNKGAIHRYIKFKVKGDFAHRSLECAHRTPS